MPNLFNKFKSSKLPNIGDLARTAKGNVKNRMPNLSDLRNSVGETANNVGGAADRLIGGATSKKRTQRRRGNMVAPAAAAPAAPYKPIPLPGRSSPQLGLGPGAIPLGQTAPSGPAINRMSSQINRLPGSEHSIVSSKPAGVIRSSSDMFRNLEDRAIRSQARRNLWRGALSPRKVAGYSDDDLEKVASVMADQFIAATSLQGIDYADMTVEDEIIAGYKSFIDEVNGNEV